MRLIGVSHSLQDFSGAGCLVRGHGVACPVWHVWLASPPVSTGNSHCRAGPIVPQLSLGMTQSCIPAPPANCVGTPCPSPHCQERPRQVETRGDVSRPPELRACPQPVAVPEGSACQQVP